MRVARFFPRKVFCAANASRKNSPASINDSRGHHWSGRAFRPGVDPDSPTVLRAPGVTSARRLLTDSAAASADRINLHARAVVNSHPTVLLTTTVPSGQILQIENWALETDGAITLTLLEVDSVEVSSVRFKNSADTRRNPVDFGINSPKEATAGQVVQIETQSGDTGKEYTADARRRTRSASTRPRR